MKYVVIDDTEMFIFPSHVDHKAFASNIMEPRQAFVTSAGFIRNSPEGLVCRGESHSLGIGSAPNDTRLLQMSLGV